MPYCDRLRPQPMPTGPTGCRSCVPATGRVCLERGPNDEFLRHHGQLGSPFHAIAKTVVVKRHLVARREILSHAQPGRRTSPGESWPTSGLQNIPKNKEN